MGGQGQQAYTRAPICISSHGVVALCISSHGVVVACAWRSCIIMRCSNMQMLAPSILVIRTYARMTLLQQQHRDMLEHTPHARTYTTCSQAGLLHEYTHACRNIPVLAFSTLSNIHMPAGRHTDRETVFRINEHELFDKQEPNNLSLLLRACRIFLQQVHVHTRTGG